MQLRTSFAHLCANVNEPCRHLLKRAPFMYVTALTAVLGTGEYLPVKALLMQTTQRSRTMHRLKSLLVTTLCAQCTRASSPYLVWE